MKITEDIKIDWHHNVEEKTTSCVLTNGETTYVAIAKAHKGDQFCRKIGRNLTLTRVLLKSGLSKNIRRQIWLMVFAKGVKILN